MCLVWLHCITSESQWLQYFKLIFLEIQNVRFRTVFPNPVTYLFTKSSDMLNKNTWDVKKGRANQKQHCKQAGTTKRFDIRKLLYQIFVRQQYYSTFSQVCSYLTLIGPAFFTPRCFCLCNVTDSSFKP